VKEYKRFGGEYITSIFKIEELQPVLLHSYWFLAWLNTEDGGNMFLCNVGFLSPALYLRR
jgi:hypothetical protein